MKKILFLLLFIPSLARATFQPVNGSTLNVQNVMNSVTVTPGTGTWSSSSVSTNTQVQGMAANGASNANNPVKQGGVGRTTWPAAVSDGQIVDLSLTKYGKVITVLDCPRDLLISTAVTLSASTAETVLLSSGAASVFNDLHLLLISNTSGTASRIDFRTNGNGTTVDFPMYIPAGDVRGLATGTMWPQGTAAANWTVQSSASVTDIRIAAVFCRNK